MVPWGASTYLNVEAQIVLLRGTHDDIGAHRIKHAHNFYFILFVSSELGVQSYKLKKWLYLFLLHVLQLNSVEGYCEGV